MLCAMQKMSSTLSRLFRFAEAMNAGATIPEAGDRLGVKRRQAYNLYYESLKLGMKFADDGRVTDWGALNPWYFRAKR